MSEHNNINTRTIEALGKDIVSKISESSFCIVGCGAVGSLFAELLVRTGATHLSLIDGDCIETTNLNRTTAFVQSDINKPKVEVLEHRLKSIAQNITVKTNRYHFRQSSPDNEKAESVNERIKSANIVIIAMDDNKYRILCENLCEENNQKYMSIGVGIEKGGNSYYECTWKPKTPKEKIDESGYGEGNVSYAAIVMEATAAGFGMLLSHLQDEDSRYKYIYRKSERFVPITKKEKIKEISKNNIFLYRLLDFGKKYYRQFCRF